MLSRALRKVVLKFSLPLNIRCSNKCAKPVLPGFSFLEPTWYQVFTATIGALWSSCTSTVSPFFRTNFVYLMSGIGICGDAPAVCAVVFDAGLAAGLGDALWLKELMPIRVTARNRPAILCMNLLLKVPPW